MASPRFLVAKYVPDLRRMEPRNIGVILWSDGNVTARFAGEHQNGKYRIDPPKHLGVQSKTAYRKWVGYWRALIEKTALKDHQGGTVERREQAFVDLLREKSKPQYRLVDGGEFLIELKPGEIDAATDELFEELVMAEPEARNNERTEAARELARNCRAAITASGLRDRKDFWTSGFDWLCPVRKKLLPFHFDFALHDTQPRAIMTRVSLWKPEDVYSKIFEFREMKRAYKIPQAKCAALIYPTAADLLDDECQALWGAMGSVGTVIDMRDVKYASLRFQSLVS